MRNIHQICANKPDERIRDIVSMDEYIRKVIRNNKKNSNQDKNDSILDKVWTKGYNTAIKLVYKAIGDYNKGAR